MEKGQENNQIDEEDDSNNVTNTKMENHPKDKKGLETESTEIEEKGDQSPGTARNKEVNPGDIKDPKTAEKEIDKTSGDKASPATANESESMPEENTSPGTAANTLDDHGYIKNPKTASTEMENHPGDEMAPFAAAKELDDPGDIKDPVTAEKEIDKTSGAKASPDTENEVNNPQDNKTTETEINGTCEDKASPATEKERKGMSEENIRPGSAAKNVADEGEEEKYTEITQTEGMYREDKPADKKSSLALSNEDADKGEEGKSTVKTPNNSGETNGEGRHTKKTPSQDDKTSEYKTPPATANERKGMSEEYISPGSAAKNVAEKCEEEKSSEITKTEGDDMSADKITTSTAAYNEEDKPADKTSSLASSNDDADKGEEGKYTVKTPNNNGETNGEGRHTKQTPSQDDGNVIKRKQSKDSKNRERLKEAERKLEEAEQNIKALTQSLDNANRQVEEAVQSRDEAEESLMKKVEAHAKVCEESWNFEKENLHLKEKMKKIGKEQKDEIDRLKTETNEQSKRIDTLQKTISKKNQNQELMKNKHQAELERERKTHEKQKQHLQQLVDENKRLKWFENAYPSLQHENQQLNSNLQIAERKQNRDKETIQALSKQNESLYEEKQELLLRLSKIAGANLTLNNPNIADLSDDKRPTKLAEEFSELYDNEWTDAFEVIEIKEERDKTTYMLLLLQRASDICREISDTHIHDIKKGLCHMTFRTKSISAEEVTTSITEPTANECQEGKNNDQSQSDDDFIMINIDKTKENSEQDSDELKTQQIVHTGASNENSGSKYTLNNEGSPETPGENDDEEILDDTKASLEDKMNFDSKQEDLQTNLAKEYETCESLSDINVGNPAETQNTNTKHIKDELTQGNEQNEETPADQDALQPTVTAAHFVEPMQNNAQAPLAETATQMETEKEQTQLQPLVTCLTDEDTKQANEDLSEMSPHGGSKGEPHVQEAQKDSNGHLSSDVGSKAGQNVNQSVSRVTWEDGSRVQANPNEPSEVGYSENGNAQIPPKCTDVTDTSTQTDSEKSPTQLHQSVLNKQSHTDASIDITTHDKFKAEHNVNQSVSGESEENGNGDDKQTDQNPKVEYSELVNEIKFDFDSLRNDQKKTVMELRKFIEINVSHQIEKDVANAIAAENKIDDVKDEMIVKYIKKCVNVCWSMCRHEPPVYIEFHDIQGDQKFDSNVFKPYTKSGKHLHYVVWPALLLHKDGPMLCKGVAQGR